MFPKIACHIHERINEKSKLKLNKNSPSPYSRANFFFCDYDMILLIKKFNTDILYLTCMVFI